MTNHFTTPAIIAAHDEEHVVAALNDLGVSYLSRQRPLSSGEVAAVRALGPDVLLSDIVRQPSARVRAAVISLLLVRPDYWHAATPACDGLAPADRLTLEIFYTAAVSLQSLYAAAIRSHLGSSWLPLPDLFAFTLGLRGDVPSAQRLADLGRRHAELTDSHLNWEGTYRDAASRLLRQWDCETRWTS